MQSSGPEVAGRGSALTLPKSFPARFGAKGDECHPGVARWPWGPKGEVCAPEVWRRSNGAAAWTVPRPLPDNHGSPGLSRCLKRTERSPDTPEPRHHRSPRARPQLTGCRRLDAVTGCARGEAPAVLKFWAGTARPPPPSGPPSLLPAALSRARLPVGDVRTRRARGRDRGRPTGTPSLCRLPSGAPQRSRELEVFCWSPHLCHSSSLDFRTCDSPFLPSTHLCLSC